MPTTNTHVPLWGGSCWAQDDGVLVSCRVSQYNLYYKAHSQDERILVTKFCDVRGFRLSLFIYHADFSVLDILIDGWWDGWTLHLTQEFISTHLPWSQLAGWWENQLNLITQAHILAFSLKMLLKLSWWRIYTKLKRNCILQYKMRFCQNQNQHNKGVKNGLFLRFPTSKCLPPNKTSM